MWGTKNEEYVCEDKRENEHKRRVCDENGRKEDRQDINEKRVWEEGKERKCKGNKREEGVMEIKGKRLSEESKGKKVWRK